MLSRFPLIAITMVAVLSLSACANTVRGVGRDVGSTVDATQGAVSDIAE